MILKGESAEEFNRKADENYEKFKARQKQNLIDTMEADEKLGLYEKPQQETGKCTCGTNTSSNGKTFDVTDIKCKIHGFGIEKPQPTEDVEALALKEYPNGMPFSDENLEQREAFTKGYQLARNNRPKQRR